MSVSRGYMNDKWSPRPFAERGRNPTGNGPFGRTEYGSGYRPQARPGPFVRGGGRPAFRAGRGRGRGRGRGAVGWNNGNGGGDQSPWITHEILEKIKEKDECWNVFNKAQTEENHRRFKLKRFEVNMAVNDAKILYYQQNKANQGGYKPNTKSKAEFCCDPCDKEFATQQLLDAHKEEHITCKLDGCTYTAHTKLVMKHIEIQHSTDLFQRIKGYDTPEDIEKWKQERKKNFPTPDNILRKRAEASERKSRGEQLTEKDDFPGIENFRHKIIPERPNNKPRFNRHGPHYQSDGEEEVYPSPHSWKFKTAPLSSFNKSPAIRLLNCYTDIKLGKDGIVIGLVREAWMNSGDCDNVETDVCKNGSGVSDVEFDITDDEFDCNTTLNNMHPENQPPFTPGENTVACIAAKSINVSNLVGYGTNSDSEEGEVKSDAEETVISSSAAATKPNSNSQVPSKIVSNCIDSPLSSDQDAPEEVPAIISKEVDNPIILKSQISQNSPPTSSTSRKRRGSKPPKKSNKRSLPHSNPDFQAKRVRKKYSLLQRLLAPDIRREKNMVLQVCRFIVDNNFLESETKQPQVADNK